LKNKYENEQLMHTLHVKKLQDEFEEKERKYVGCKLFIFIERRNQTSK